MLPIVLIGLTPFAFAEIEKGINFDKEILQTFPNGSQEIKTTILSYDRIKNGELWQDYIFADLGNSLEIKTSKNIIRLDKSTCGFSFHNSNNALLFQDSIIAFNSIVDAYTWNQITQINNAVCEAYYDQGNNALVAKRYASGVGFMEYKYIFNSGLWKTQLEATNLTSLTNRVFAFDQTININRDSINFGGSIKNLDNFNGQTFARSWLENNEAKVLDFLNNYYFDLDLGFDYLDSVNVVDSGANSSKLVFHYMRNNQILMPNETLIIDPTYGYTTGTFKAVYDTGCNGVVDGTQPTMYIQVDGANCFYSGAYFDITSIDDSSTIISATLRYDVVSVASGTETGNIISIEGNLSTMTNQQIEDDIKTGTYFLTSSSNFYTVANDYTLVNNANMIADIQAELAIDNEWGVGFLGDDTTPTPSTLTDLGTTNIELTLVYTTIPPPNAITDLALDSSTQTTATLSFTAPDLNGESLINYMLNMTTPQQDAPITTFKMNATSSPFSVTGLTLGTSYSAQATAFTAGGGNWTYANVLNFTTNSFNPPGAPSLGASALSDSALRFTSVRGTAGDNSTIWYGLRCELNEAGSWSTVVSNSSLPSPSIYEYTGLTLGDELICQWRDGSVDGFGEWSNNATDTLQLQVLTAQRTDDTNDHLLAFINFVTSQGGVYFGLGVIPFAVMLIGFMAGKKTVRIFTLITLSLMGIIHASGYYVYPDWYWTLSLLFGIALVLGRMKSD